MAFVHARAQGLARRALDARHRRQSRRRRRRVRGRSGRRVLLGEIHDETARRCGQVSARRRVHGAVARVRRLRRRALEGERARRSGEQWRSCSTRRARCAARPDAAQLIAHVTVSPPMMSPSGSRADAWSARVGVAASDVGPACMALGSLGVLPRVVDCRRVHRDASVRLADRWSLACIRARPLCCPPFGPAGSRWAVSRRIVG